MVDYEIALDLKKKSLQRLLWGLCFLSWNLMKLRWFRKEARMSDLMQTEKMEKRNEKNVLSYYDVEDPRNENSASYEFAET